MFDDLSKILLRSNPRKYFSVSVNVQMFISISRLPNDITAVDWSEDAISTDFAPLASWIFSYRWRQLKWNFATVMRK